jgi:two-component system, OmpR family, alkaline phosphatase synthesis response regulator PhoP
MAVVKKKILVVDDESEIVDFLEGFLKRFNLHVIKAVNGNEAIELYDKERPDWVFLDIMMPDRDGISVLKELKKMDSRVKVIIITGKEEKVFREKTQKAGAIDYITKPLDLGDLSRKIKTYIINEN